MLVSISGLSDLTGKDRRTITKALKAANLKPEKVERKAHLYDSVAALEAIFDPPGKSDAPRGEDTSNVVSINGERMRLLRAQREKVELDLKARRKELMPISEIADFVSKMITNAKAKILAIPSKASPEVAEMEDPNEVQALLKLFVHDALSELAEYDPDEYEIDTGQSDSASVDTPAQSKR